MDENQWVDELYKAFWRTLPGMLHAEAQALAHTLGLAPSRDVPWSAVFSNEFTLSAPALLAEAMPGVRGATVQDALLAHLLAVIEAFGTDRIKDAQVRPTWQLEAILAHARRARDAALRRVAPGVDDPAIDFSRADDATLLAIEAERSLLASGEPAGFSRYYALSLGKQRVGFPASIALAHAAGWTAERRAALERLLSSVWLGLQLHDDVMDWQDDYERGGAWAVVLASELRSRAQGEPEERDPERAARQNPRSAYGPLATPPWGMAAISRAPGEPPPSSAPSALVPVRRMVFDSGVLAAMLDGERRCFRAARRRAAVLGARRVAAWAEGREAQAHQLARCEVESPGYANRAQALNAWARAVLA
ncbi:hypothetical protein SOCEGT47_024750 [Sorangium cellulosum]|jgi:hypothetical protein|uniref:Uncharacterized protein n=1 Tax=Sorangium cellulosum TaxID=56 RepID=A0A4P2PYN4_SORCE|nr:hypothetical protein [Sorangium cellulosum]AUX21974.1 hypothetical protein SOCEGT47_024750 [Sorangium cellulosum]